MARGPGKAVLAFALVILAARALARRPGPGPAPGPGPHPPGPSPRPPGAGREVAKFLSGNLDEKAWAGSRWRACVVALDERGVTGDTSEIAARIVAHWAIETDWGRAEFNYNLGGIHAYEGVDWFASRDADVPTHFAAWHTLQDGVRGYLDLLQHHYADCWGELVDTTAPARSWYDCLGSHGYYGQAGAYSDARMRVLQDVGDSPWT
jgi:hypothetical protein